MIFDNESRRKQDEAAQTIVGVLARDVSSLLAHAGQTNGQLDRMEMLLAQIAGNTERIAGALESQAVHAQRVVQMMEGRHAVTNGREG